MGCAAINGIKIGAAPPGSGPNLRDDFDFDFDKED